MSSRQHDLAFDDRQQGWRTLLLAGGLSTIVVLAGIALDLILGIITGGDMSGLPQTAVDRFAQLQRSPLLGLYNMDLLNSVNQVIMIPGYFALYAAHRGRKDSAAALALILFLVGTTILVTNNTALTMLDLGNKYWMATTEAQRTLLAAAGEAMLARGSHGNLGAFPGFLLPTIAGLIMSFVMLGGRVFTTLTAWLGVIGSFVMTAYMVLVTFAPGVRQMATAFAAPGGLLLMAWMILFTIRLIRLGRAKGA